VLIVEVILVIAILLLIGTTTTLRILTATILLASL